MTNLLRRDRIFENPHVEVLHICWRPGEATEAHDHGDSYGLIRVIDGRIFQDVFDKKTKKLIDSMIHLPGDIIQETPDIIHIMGNPSKTRIAVTTHVYMPVLKMTKHDLNPAGESCETCQGNGEYISSILPGEKMISCKNCGRRGRVLIKPQK